MRQREAGAPPATPPIAAARPAESGGRRRPRCLKCPRRTTPSRKTCASPSSSAFTGDLDEMVKRRVIRVGVTFNRTHYFIDKGQQRGLAYESIKLFEDDLNADLKTGNLKVHVAPSRCRAISWPPRS